MPIYAATILVMAHCSTMILFALLAPTSLNWLWDACLFSSSEVMGGQVWRMATYAFAHNISMEGWGFLLNMAALFWFGQEVEKFLGRRNFLILYGTLLLSAPLFLTVVSFFGPSTLLVGSGPLHFSLLIAFAAIYPSAEIFFGIQARWIALVVFGLNTLIYISSQAWTQFSVLWQECGTALLVLRFMGVYSLQGWPPVEKMEKAVRAVVPQPKAKLPPKKQTAPPNVDAILDKIARHGISSLSAEERRMLEQEREALLEKERRG